MREVIVRWGAVVVLLVSLIPTGASAAAETSVCAAPIDPRQAELDRGGIAEARAGGLALRVVRQCAGFSVVVDDGIDDALASEYADRAQQAYAQLASESGAQLSPRAVLLVFSNQDGMATGERVLGGLPSLVREPRAGYTWMNTVWLDDSQFPVASSRARSVAHEFSHLFAAATAKGKRIPSWFDEGLAVDSEITLSHADFAAASAADARREQDTVLDALSGRGPLPLFALDTLETTRLWQEHYVDPDQQRLEYAQAYMTVRAALDNGGRDAAWRVLHVMGEADLDFGTAFQNAFGRSVDDVDAAARDAWQTQVAGPPEPLHLDIALAPSGDDQAVEILLTAMFDQSVTQLSGSVGSGTRLAVDVQPDGTLAGPSADFETTTHDLSGVAELRPGDGHLMVAIRRGDGRSEMAAFDRHYGHWDASPTRAVSDPNAEQHLAMLNGPISDPFPSGDRVIPNFAG